MYVSSNSSKYSKQNHCQVFVFCHSYYSKDLWGTTPSNHQITNRSFTYTVLSLWNLLPLDLRLRSSPDQTFNVFLSPAVFHKRLKTYLFNLSFPRPQQLPPTRTDIWILTRLVSYPSYFIGLFSWCHRISLT